GAGVGLSSSLAEHGKAIVENALRETGGRVYGASGAAARLGIPRSTLEWKIRALKIDKSRFSTLASKSSYPPRRVWAEATSYPNVALTQSSPQTIQARADRP